MESFRTEEEQVEAIRRWWKANGKSICIGIVLACSVIGGWQLFQSHNQKVAQDASVIYQSLLDAANIIATAPAGEDVSDDVATFNYLANNLKSDYSDSTYAAYASLFLAKRAAEAKDFVVAETELRWVMEKNFNRSLYLVSKLRLARVIAAQGDTEAALALIEAEDAGSHTASYEEVKGDLYLTQARIEEARTAYEKGMVAVIASGQSDRQLLKMKLDNLAVEPKLLELNVDEPQEDAVEE